MKSVDRNVVAVTPEYELDASRVGDVNYRVLKILHRRLERVES